MSSNSNNVQKGNSTESSHSIMTYSALKSQSKYVVQCISSAFDKVELVKSDFDGEYQKEKHVLTELNEQFRYMIDRVYQLESRNSRYIEKIAELRRQAFMTSISSKHTVELDHTQADVTRINYDKVSYESETEYFQLQCQIYQLMIQGEQRPIDEVRLKFERELNESASNLANLRASYTTLEQQVKTCRATLKNTFNQYMALAKEWSILRKKTKEIQFNIDMVKNQVQFTKNLYA